MSIVVIVLSAVMIGSHVNAALDDLFFVRSTMGIMANRNSLFDDEIVIKNDSGTKAEDVYVVERLDQINKLEALKKEIKRLQQREKTKKQEAALSSLNEKLSTLERESKENKFCSQLDELCGKAFASSYFTKNKWKLEDPNAECVFKEVSAKFRKNSFDGTRQVVKCNIKNENGNTAFLDASTRYEQGKKLRFFVMIEENGKLKPIAFLMNKKWKMKEIPIEDPAAEAERKAKARGYF